MMRRPLLGLVGALALTACGKSAPAATEILWDRWGVPHIYAANDAEAFRGFGYAQAAAHADLLLKLYGEARGRSAEYWGEANLPGDRFVRTMGVPARAAEWYATMDPAFRANLDAFAAGINQYAERYPDRIADSVKVVLPVTAQDAIAHGQRVIYFLFMFFGQVDVPATLTNTRPGSNMWAVGPARSATGNPLLLGNPHLPWTDLYLFFEAHQVTPDRSLYGVSLVGVPTLVLGFNDFIAWSHTVNTQDGADVYRVPKQGTGYRHDGAELAFSTRAETISVKRPDGSLRIDTITVKETVHGPVISEDAQAALAVRVAGLDDPGAVVQWWRMGGAKNMTEFESLIRPIHVPFFNIMAAGQDGNILYFFGGKTPRRPDGDAAHWAAPVPGDSGALVWTEYFRYEELPRLRNPASGWLQNANDPPWTATWPLAFDPDTFPAYMAPRRMGFRAQQSALLQLADSSVTLDEMVEAKHSTRMALADRVLEELIAAAEREGDADAKRAAEVLARWDRHADAESRGAVLFSRWVRHWYRATRGQGFASPWRLDSALTTPAGLANPSDAVRTLSTAAREVVKDYGALDVPYGDVMRLRYGGKDLPGNGAPGDPLGVFRVAGYAPDADGKFRIVEGDTYYQAVELSKPVRAKVLLAYGNATQPGSKYIGDQLELFAAKQMRDAWLTRADIEANLDAREELPPATSAGPGDR